MKCWVCSRQARGLVHSDTRQRVGVPARYPIDWAFCSMRCQAAFHKMYGVWVRAVDDGKPREECMVDITPLEQEAMRRSLRYFGEAASEIGFDTPLGAYSQEQALQVIEAIVTGYVTAMAELHEQTRYPTVRMDGPPVNDPIRECDAAIAALKDQSSADHPFADMANDLPWEGS
jgi:hypothetical protein